MSEPTKILVCGPAWVGDMVMAQSLLKKLRQRFPAAELHVLAPSLTIPLLKRMPETDGVIELDIGHGQLRLRRRWAIARQLRAQGYERAIIYQRSWKAALIPYLAGIPLRIGFNGYTRFPLINEPRQLQQTRLPRTVDRLVALGEDPGAPQPPAWDPPALDIDAAARGRLCGQLHLDSSQPAIALFPGAEFGDSKQWPLEHFAALASRLTEHGFQIWVMGSPKDVHRGEFIVTHAQGPIHNLCGQTQLEQAIDLISLCQAAVTNDSGLMHIAAAVGVHVEVLYGGSTPDYTPPLTANSTIHYLRLDCSPCFKRQCPLGHKNCLQQLEPTQVAASLLTALEQRPEPTKAS